MTGLPKLLPALAVGLIGCISVFLIVFLYPIMAGEFVGKELWVAAIIVAAITPVLATWKIRSQVSATGVGALLGGLEWGLLICGGYWAYLSGFGGLEIQSFPSGDYDQEQYVISILTAFMPVALGGGSLLGFFGWAFHDLVKQWLGQDNRVRDPLGWHK